MLYIGEGNAFLAKFMENNVSNFKHPFTFTQGLGQVLVSMVQAASWKDLYLVTYMKGFMMEFTYTAITEKW